MSSCEDTALHLFGNGEPVTLCSSASPRGDEVPTARPAHPGAPIGWGPATD